MREATAQSMIDGGAVARPCLQSDLTQLRLHAQNTLNKQDSSTVRSDSMNKRIGADAAFKVTELLDANGSFI